MSGAIKIPGGSMTWLMEDAIQPGVGISLAEMKVEPGQMTELHRHDNCSEEIILIEGQILQRVDDQWIEMFPGDRCVISMGSPHQTRNIGEDTAKMLLSYSSGQRHYKKLG